MKGWKVSKLESLGTSPKRGDKMSHGVPCYVRMLTIAASMKMGQNVMSVPLTRHVDQFVSVCRLQGSGDTIFRRQVCS